MVKKLKEDSRIIAQTDFNVLLLGESGTGKEIIARAIHNASSRAKGRFIQVNCGAIPEDLFESELFGHEKGAFTGAITTKPGRFELANRGTIFLDEVGDTPLPLQVKLLHVIENKRFERLGGIETIETDCRVIAATNQDLKEKMEKGEFRKDLYWRLSVSIHIPPLRERKADIPLLAEYFLKKYSAQTTVKQVKGFSKEAMKVLTNYDWPGNIRQLKSAIETTFIFAKSDIIKASDLLPSEIHTASEEILENCNGTLKDAQKKFQKAFIIKALKQTNGNRTEAAKQLKIQRTYLSRLIKELDIKRWGV